VPGLEAVQENSEGILAKCKAACGASGWAVSDNATNRELRMEPTDFQHVERQFPVPARLSLFPEVDNSSTSNNKCSSDKYARRWCVSKEKIVNDLKGDE
jgi:hypothetical protein